MLNCHNKYSYKIEEAVKCNTNMCVLFVPFSYTIRHWFGVTGSHDMEAIEHLNLLMVPKSDYGSARASGRRANRRPATNTG